MYLNAGAVNVSVLAAVVDCFVVFVSVVMRSLCTELYFVFLCVFVFVFFFYLETKHGERDHLGWKKREMFSHMFNG